MENKSNIVNAAQEGLQKECDPAEVENNSDPCMNGNGESPARTAHAARVTRTARVFSFFTIFVRNKVCLNTCRQIFNFSF